MKQRVKSMDSLPTPSYECVRPAAMLEKAEPPALCRTTEPAFQGILGRLRLTIHGCIHDSEIKPWKSTYGRFTTSQIFICCEVMKDSCGDGRTAFLLADLHCRQSANSFLPDWDPPLGWTSQSLMDITSTWQNRLTWTMTLKSYKLNLS